MVTKPIEVNDADFDQTVLKSAEPVMEDFWAPWCRPCLMVAPILDELADEYRGRVTVARVDVDQNPKVAARYSIMSIPSLLIFKNGQPISNIVGFRPKPELKQALDAALD